MLPTFRAPVRNTRRRRGAAGMRHALLATLGLLLVACVDYRDATTAPASPEAAAINWLWWTSVVLGTAVYVIVMILLVIPVLRSRRQDPDGADGKDALPPLAAELDEPAATADPALAEAANRDQAARSRLVWFGGIIGPAAVLLVLLVASSTVGSSVAHNERDGELVVEVVGHMFWWEVRYPEEGIVTANEIRVPVDRPVRLVLTTEDVIHSFWIPRLHGKVDMIPGRENWLTFEATETGFFRGQCAEFCGIAHAQMVAFVEVLEPDDYDAWVAEQQQDAPEVDGRLAEGERVFFEAGCAACHAVRGTAAVAGVGPDLTHLSTRETLGAGIVPNTRANLEALILDPWSVKPGNPMPPTELEGEELEALLDYLEEL